MVVTIFRSTLRTDAGERYNAVAEEMLELAKSMPGFGSFKTFSSRDGERVSIIEFESMQALEAWRDHPGHRRAQVLGRESFYSRYRIQVCQPLHVASFEREVGATENVERGESHGG